jgi:hypothetical protein
MLLRSHSLTPRLDSRDSKCSGWQPAPTVRTVGVRTGSRASATSPMTRSSYYSRNLRSATASPSSIDTVKCRLVNRSGNLAHHHEITCYSRYETQGSRGAAAAGCPGEAARSTDDWRPERRIKPGMDGGLTAASVVSPLHHLRTGKILSKRWGPPHLSM